MNLKLGDLVMRKKSSNDLLFQVTGFDGEYVLLKGVKIPIITISQSEELIKLNRTREKSIPGLRRVK